MKFDRTLDDSVQEGELNHQTSFFRDPVIQNFPKWLVRRFPSGVVPIDNYGCADGSEPYSLAIGLVDQIGFESAARRFPIQAMDRGGRLIQENQRGRVILSDTVVDSEIPIRVLDRQYRDALAAITPKPFERFFERPVVDTYGRLVYSVSTDLRALVTFGHADITEDVLRLNHPGPSVVVFRNAWYHLELQQAQKMAHDLFRALKSGSLVVIGGHEFEKEIVLGHVQGQAVVEPRPKVNDSENASAIQLLLNSGFRPLPVSALSQIHPQQPRRPWVWEKP